MTYLKPDIVPDRIKTKVRPYGITMILDRCQGLKATEDLISMTGDYLDQIKLSSGTATLVSENFLRNKIDLVVSNRIDIYPGGTLMEIAFQQKNESQYIKWVKELGFTTIEISDGIFKLSRKRRNDAINRSREYGLKVITEVGSKDPDVEIPVSRLCDEINSDLKSDVKMFRLLQGDVGSGKTIVSLISAANVIKSDYQVALMAPTEILATQHYELAKRIYKFW